MITVKKPLGRPPGMFEPGEPFTKARALIVITAASLSIWGAIWWLIWVAIR